MIYLQFRILPQYVGIVKHEDNILIRIEVPGEILYPSQTGQVKTSIVGQNIRKHSITKPLS